MVEEWRDAKEHFYEELNDAMDFVEANVECGKRMSIVGTWTDKFNRKDVSRNWYYAVGGYWACGCGKAKIVCTSTGERKYKVEFEFHFDDRYNWDTGKGVNIVGIHVSDASLGRLHKVGIAHEFDMTGKATKTVTWEKGQRFDVRTGTLRGSGGDSDDRRDNSNERGER
jgi:hypothetical protein